MVISVMPMRWGNLRMLALPGEIKHQGLRVAKTDYRQES